MSRRKLHARSALLGENRKLTGASTSFNRDRFPFLIPSPIVAAAIYCVGFCSVIVAQSMQTPLRSPKEVVEAYRGMDAKGGCLTPSGWQKCNVFFLHPGLPPRERILGVMTGEIVGQATINGDKGEVWTEFDLLGKVYPTGRFSRSLGGSPPLKGPLPSARKYSLVLTAQGTEPHAEGGPQWKIADFEPNSTVSVDVAIHYLERLRDKSDSQSVKKNAEQSIGELTALRNKQQR
jgi:hypothetical protein